MSDTPSKEKSDFTPREMEIMAKAWCCMTDEPKIDLPKLAGMCGMTNPKSAGNAWTNITKKILAHAGVTKEDGDGTGSPTKKTPKATPRKRTKIAAGEGEGGDDEETPVKKTKPTPKKKGTAKSEAIIEGDGEGEPEVKEEAAED